MQEIIKEAFGRNDLQLAAKRLPVRTNFQINQTETRQRLQFAGVETSMADEALGNEALVKVSTLLTEAPLENTVDTWAGSSLQGILENLLGTQGAAAEAGAFLLDQAAHNLLARGEISSDIPSSDKVDGSFDTLTKKLFQNTGESVEEKKAVFIFVVWLLMETREIDLTPEGSTEEMFFRGLVAPKQPAWDKDDPDQWNIGNRFRETIIKALGERAEQIVTPDRNEDPEGYRTAEAEKDKIQAASLSLQLFEGEYGFPWPAGPYKFPVTRQQARGPMVAALRLLRRVPKFVFDLFADEMRLTSHPIQMTPFVGQVVRLETDVSAKWVAIRRPSRVPWNLPWPSLGQRGYDLGEGTGIQFEIPEAAFFVFALVQTGTNYQISRMVEIYPLAYCARCRKGGARLVEIEMGQTPLECEWTLLHPEPPQVLDMVDEKHYSLTWHWNMVTRYVKTYLWPSDYEKARAAASLWTHADFSEGTDPLAIGASQAEVEVRTDKMEDSLLKNHLSIVAQTLMQQLKPVKLANRGLNPPGPQPPARRVDDNGLMQWSHYRQQKRTVRIGYRGVHSAMKAHPDFFVPYGPPPSMVPQLVGKRQLALIDEYNKFLLGVDRDRLLGDDDYYESVWRKTLETMDTYNKLMEEVNPLLETRPELFRLIYKGEQAVSVRKDRSGNWVEILEDDDYRDEEGREETDASGATFIFRKNPSFERIPQSFVDRYLAQA
jgi:hypothetical protein